MNWGLSPVAPTQSNQSILSVDSYSTKYTWWLVSWETNSIICSITVYHGGLPSVEETRKNCGNTYTTQWLDTPSCNFNKVCQGYYMHLASSSSVITPSGSRDSILSPSLSSSTIAQNQTTPNPVDACAVIWQTQPLSVRPYWLTTPVNSFELATNEDLYYLAGRLIANGIVNASSCPAGGLESSHYANECGMAAARPVVQYWQNQFDPEIYRSAQVAGIPAVLLKRLFIQESQMWPGTDLLPTHFGLGQATELGLDVLFVYDSEFYKQFCSLILSGDACQKNYSHQSPENKAILRGALTYRINADCPSCPTGIDIELTRDSIPIFSNLIVANCRQVAQIVFNATGFPAGSVSNYEDLWRFTLANYHVGSGCLSYALFTAWNRTHSLDGEEVGARFTEPCSSAVPYVQNISSAAP